MLCWRTCVRNMPISWEKQRSLRACPCDRLGKARHGMQKV
jgi:hypothetical protein